MKEVYLGIKDILDEFFSTTSAYNVVDGTQYIIDTANDYIYGMDFPETPVNGANAQYPQNGNLNVNLQTDFTRIFFKPKENIFYSKEVMEEDVEGEENQVLIQHYNEYLAKFDLVLYTKSLAPAFESQAFIIQELFFNIFRGNVPYIPYLHNRNVWSFSFENYQVRDLSFVENANGVSRYEASFNTRYRKITNSYILDKLKNIVLDEVKCI